MSFCCVAICTVVLFFTSIFLTLRTNRGVLKVRNFDDGERPVRQRYERPSVIEEQRRHLEMEDALDWLPQPMPNLQMVDPKRVDSTRMYEDDEFLLLH